MNRSGNRRMLRGLAWLVAEAHCCLRPVGQVSIWISGRPLSDDKRSAERRWQGHSEGNVVDCPRSGPRAHLKTVLRCPASQGASCNGYRMRCLARCHPGTASCGTPSRIDAWPAGECTYTPVGRSVAVADVSVRDIIGWRFGVNGQRAGSRGRVPFHNSRAPNLPRRQL